MPHVKPYKDSAGEYRWTLYADNGEALAVSSEGYSTKSSLERALQNLPQWVSLMEIEELDDEVEAD